MQLLTNYHQVPFTAGILLVRQTASHQGASPFVDIDKDVIASATLLNQKIKNHQKGEPPNWTKNKTLDIVAGLARHNVLLIASGHHDCPELVHVRDQVCLRISDLELFISVAGTVSNSIRNVSTRGIEAFLAEASLSEPTARLLGLPHERPLGQLINNSDRLSLFALSLFSAEHDIPWQSVLECTTKKTEISKQDVGRLKSFTAHLRRQLTLEQVEANRKLFDKLLKEIRIDELPPEPDPDIPFDFSGDWTIEAAELHVNQTSFDNLSQLHTDHWTFLKRQAHAADANAAEGAKPPKRTPLGDFNKTKGNLVRFKQLFRGGVRFVHASEAAGTGERETLNLYKMDETHPLRYVVGKVEINGRLVEARYSFDAKIENAEGVVQTLESRGDFKLTAVGQNELRGGYVGFEPFDMATPPKMPRREFPIVLGILKVTRIVD